MAVSFLNVEQVASGIWCGDLPDIPAVFAEVLTVILGGLIVEKNYRKSERNIFQEWGAQNDQRKNAAGAIAQRTLVRTG